MSCVRGDLCQLPHIIMNNNKRQWKIFEHTGYSLINVCFGVAFFFLRNWKLISRGNSSFKRKEELKLYAKSRAEERGHFRSEDCIGLTSISLKSILTSSWYYSMYIMQISKELYMYSMFSHTIFAPFVSGVVSAKTKHAALTTSFPDALWCETSKCIQNTGSTEHSYMKM